MPRNVYAEINLHVTWHTKGSAPVLAEPVAQHLYRFIEKRALGTPGVQIHAIGGTANHIHVAVSVAPTVDISRWVGDLKGASAHYLNHRIANRKLLDWQTGYGIVSFGTKDLDWVVQYIRNQRQHHQSGRSHERLERTEAVSP